MSFNISHSLLNNFSDFIIGDLCGHQFKAILDKVINKSDLFGETDALNQGNFFEYKCTGAVPRDGRLPLPKSTKSGLTAPYENLLCQVEHWKKFSEIHITNIQIGLDYKLEYDGFTVRCLPDIKCLFDGRPSFIDMKSSGVIDDKWHPGSWANISNKKNKTRQGVIYKWIGKQVDNIDYDFYFYVASSSDPVKRKFIKIKTTESSFEDLIKEMKFAKEMIEYHNATGYPVGSDMNPEFYLKCAKCPDILRDNCKDRIDFPPMEIIHL